MGKRKRRAVYNKATPPASGSSQVDLQPGQRSPDQAESSEPLSQTPSMDVMDASLKKSPAPESPHSQNHGPSRTVLLRRCRPPIGRPYSRRSSSNHPDASPSNLKASPDYDSMLSFKKETEDLPHFSHPESREITFQRPERIMPNLSGDIRMMECMICQKRLRKKNAFVSENPVSPADVSVVAVLVCGHAYHADCLEQKTSHRDRQDPPCPLCESHIP